MRSSLVGREHELAALRQALGEAVAGRRRLALVSGEAGIGKSRLLDEFATSAAADGALVAWGRCWEAAGAPAYWPWTELLRATLAEEDAREVVAELVQLLPEVGGSGDDADPSRFLLFEAVAEHFAAVALRQPLVLVLDDVHAADTPSLLLLRFLAGRPDAARLLLVAAYRDVELTPGDQLTQVLADVGRLPSATRLVLRGLDEAGVAELTELTTSIVPSRATAAVLRERTDGNPLYVREVVTLLAAEGELTPKRAATRVTIPPDVRETVLRRFGRLDAGARQTLQTAAIFGRDFRVDVLARLLPGVDVPEALGAAEGANVVGPVADHPGRFRFAHALFAEALYDGLPAARRLELHGRAGDELESLYADDVDSHLAELAHHFGAAVPLGDTGKAVDYALRAGERAVRMLAYEEGIRLYRLAAGVMESAGRPASERCRVLLSLGDAEARAGLGDAARTTYEAAARLAREQGDWRNLAEAALGYGGRFVWLRAGPDTRLVPLLREALATVADRAPELRVRLLARLSGALRDDASMDERDALSAAAVQLAEQLGDKELTAYALAGRFMAIWGPHTVDELESLAGRIHATAADSGNGERLADAHWLLFECALTRGNVDEARRIVSAGREVAAALRQPAQSWYAAVIDSALRLLDGDLAGAEEAIHETRSFGVEAHTWHADASELLSLAVLRWHQGRLEELREPLEHAVGAYPGYRIFGCFLALLHAEAGRRERAAELVASVGDSLPTDNGWLSGMTLLAEAVARLDLAESAAQIRDALVPYAGLVGVAAGEPVTGSIQRPIGQLAAVLGDLDGAQARLEAALDVHRRMPAPTWEAHTQFDLARVLLARSGPGDAERAESMLSAAAEAASRMGLDGLAQRVASLRAGSARRERAVPQPDAATFVAEGDQWRIEFDGRAFRLRDAKGLRYLAALLARPGVDVAAVDLVTPGAPVTVSARAADGGPEGDLGEVLDARARAAYRRRIEELQDDLDEAESMGDPERAARARAELDFVTDELTAAVGLGGRPRRTGSPAERARQSVRKAIAAALDRIGEHDPALKAHLAATVRTGYVCRYEPDPRLPTSWRT